MSDWPISSLTGDKLIKFASNRKSKNDKKFYKKKTVNYSRIKNQRQNSSNLKSEEGLYKPHKIPSLIPKKFDS